MQLIGLSGYAQSGKDTVAHFLGDDGWQRVSFADSLRDVLYALNPIIEDGTRLAALVDATGWDHAKILSPETRSLLQRMGTEAGRGILGDDIWVETALRKCTDPNGKYVFTDCRFPNEAAMVKKNGGIMARLSRPGVAPVNGHASETSLDTWPFDRYIENDSDLDSLRAQARVLNDVLGDTRPLFEIADLALEVGR